ncbi:hypothetical protein [Paraburkholderia susongensis]|nr:hypothetical protein [Paraburkholderia susongensis]
MFLLPMPGERVRHLSLGGHLALEATLREEGNRHLLNELTRILYFTFYLESEAGGIQEPALYLCAEAALDRAVLRATETGIWRVERDEADAIEPILRKYDEQIESVSTRRYLEAEMRITKLIGRDHTVSPLKKQLEAAGGETG